MICAPNITNKHVTTIAPNQSATNLSNFLKVSLSYLSTISPINLARIGAHIIANIDTCLLE